MNLIEAHKSGKAFKRPNWGHYMKLVSDPNGVRLQSEDGCADDYLEVTDFEATDYELEPEAKLLTKDDVIYAVELAQGKTIGFYNYSLAEEVVKILFKGGGT